MSGPVKFEFSLNEEDFLIYNLFTASKSKNIQDKEKKGRIFTSIFFLAFAVIGVVIGRLNLAVYFLVTSIISTLFYVKYFRWRYKNHYKKHIKENHQNRIGQKVTMWFDENHLISIDKTGEGKLNLTEIEVVNEIESHFFILLTSGQSIIVPKGQIHIVDFIKELENASLSIQTFQGWKW